MNFAGVQSITIPEGDVRSIAIGGVTVWTRPNPLPYDAEVEYIESTGTQYVDTGVRDIAPASLKIVMKRRGWPTCAYTSQNNANGTWLGFQLVGTTFRVYKQNYNNKINTTVDPSAPPTSTVVWDGATGFYENGVQLSSFTAALGNTSISGRPVILFGDYDLTNNVVRIGANTCAIFSCDIYSGSTLVRDFVPVRVGTAGYLFDRVSGQLFGNAGTGDFVLGPDKNGG